MDEDHVLHVEDDCTSLVVKKSGKKKMERSKNSKLERLFCCEECGKVAKTKQALERHAAYHKNDRPFSCTMCNQRFKNSDDLGKHFRRLKRDGKFDFACKACHKHFKSDTLLAKHIEMLGCTAVREETSGTLNVTEHVDDSLKQEKQDNASSTLGQPNVELRLLCFCKECEKEFNSTSALKAHYKEEHKELKRHVCLKCGQTLSSKDSLMRHYNIFHQDDFPYSCDLCFQKFKVKEGLCRHIKFVHKDGGYKCDVCQRSFSQPVNLKKHMAVHSLVKEFSCGICLKEFRWKQSLQKHLLLHSNSDDGTVITKNRKLTTNKIVAYNEISDKLAFAQVLADDTGRNVGNSKKLETQDEMERESTQIEMERDSDDIVIKLETPIESQDKEVDKNFDEFQTLIESIHEGTKDSKRHKGDDTGRFKRKSISLTSETSSNCNDNEHPNSNERCVSMKKRKETETLVNEVNTLCNEYHIPATCSQNAHSIPLGTETSSLGHIAHKIETGTGFESTHEHKHNRNNMKDTPQKIDLFDDSVVYSHAQSQNRRVGLQRSLSDHTDLNGNVRNSGSQTLACYIHSHDPNFVQEQNLDHKNEHNQANVNRQRLANVHEQNLDHENGHNQANVNRLNLANVHEQNLDHKNGHKQANVNRLNLANVHEQNLDHKNGHNQQAHNLANVNEASLLQEQNLANVSSQNLANVSSQNLTNFCEQNWASEQAHNFTNVHGVKSDQRQNLTNVISQSSTNEYVKTFTNIRPQNKCVTSNRSTVPSRRLSFRPSPISSILKQTTNKSSEDVLFVDDLQKEDSAIKVLQAGTCVNVLETVRHDSIIGVDKNSSKIKKDRKEKMYTASKSPVDSSFSKFSLIKHMLSLQNEEGFDKTLFNNPLYSLPGKLKTLQRTAEMHKVSIENGYNEYNLSVKQNIPFHWLGISVKADQNTKNAITVKKSQSAECKKHTQPLEKHYVEVIKTRENDVENGSGNIATAQVQKMTDSGDIVVIEPMSKVVSDRIQRLYPEATSNDLRGDSNHVSISIPCSNEFSECNNAVNAFEDQRRLRQYYTQTTTNNDTLSPDLLCKGTYMFNRDTDTCISQTGKKEIISVPTDLRVDKKNIGKSQSQISSSTSSFPNRTELNEHSGYVSINDDPVPQTLPVDFSLLNSSQFSNSDMTNSHSQIPVVEKSTERNNSPTPFFSVKYPLTMGYPKYYLQQTIGNVNSENAESARKMSTKNFLKESGYVSNEISVVADNVSAVSVGENDGLTRLVSNAESIDTSSSLNEVTKSSPFSVLVCVAVSLHNSNNSNLCSTSTVNSTILSTVSSNSSEPRCSSSISELYSVPHPVGLFMKNSVPTNLQKRESSSQMLD